MIGFTAAPVWFAVFVCLHILGIRAGSGARSLPGALAVSNIGFLCTAIGMSTYFGYPLLATALSAIIGLLTIACLFVLYMPGIYTVLTSLSVQTMVLLERRGGMVSEAELYTHFAGPSLFETRATALLGSGFVAVSPGGYSLTSRGLAIARTFAAMKRLWGLGPGG